MYELYWEMPALIGESIVVPLGSKLYLTVAYVYANESCAGEPLRLKSPLSNWNSKPDDV